MIDQNKLTAIYSEFGARTRNLSPYAVRPEQAVRLHTENESLMRSEFALDRDRILYSGAYRRYQGKTQVFSFTNQFDEEMTNRSLHTTYVAQIARTIGNILNLDLELIEAIALGHDLGHPPFGHDGEMALSKACHAHGGGYFHHNIESLHIVDHISRKGRGLNLTFPVRDGIISHDGEVHNQTLSPQIDKTEAHLIDYMTRKRQGEKVDWAPATLEGCVVRITDTIAYIGQDIEDAIRCGILKRDELPPRCVEYLGNRNSQMIDTLVKSIITASYGNNYVGFDEDTSAVLLELKKFNYARIYTNELVKQAHDKIGRAMAIMFEKYLDDLSRQQRKSRIYVHFLDFKHNEYIDTHTPVEQVRDFIATMTDRYFYEEFKNHVMPGRFDPTLRHV